MEQSENFVVRYFNYNLNLNFNSIEELIKDLIVKLSNDTKQTHYNNFDEFIRGICEGNSMLANFSQNQNFSIDDPTVQMLILQYFNVNINSDTSVTFDNFVQNLILLNVQAIDNSFNDYDDFLQHIESVYCTFDGFINYCKLKDISQSAEKEKIKNIYENLPQKEKRKLNFTTLVNSQNRDLALFLINLCAESENGMNNNIKYKNDEFKSHFLYLFLNNQEMTGNELLDYFSQNFAYPPKDTFVQNPFLRLCIALQLGINLYNDDGELEPNNVGKIISHQDYQYYRRLLNQLGISQQNHSQYSSICHNYAFFLSFYKCLPNASLTDFDKFIMTEYIEQPKKPLEIFGYSIGWGILAGVCGFLAPGAIAFAAFAALIFCAFAASCCGIMIGGCETLAYGVLGLIIAVPLAFCSYLFFTALAVSLQLTIVGGLAAAAFVITTIVFLSIYLYQNAEIKKKQDQFKPKTKKDKTKKIEIVKEEDITQETPKEANQETTNDVNAPLLANVTQNENSSNNGMPPSSHSNENELSD